MHPFTVMFEKHTGCPESRQVKITQQHHLLEREQLSGAFAECSLKFDEQMAPCPVSGRAAGSGLGGRGPVSEPQGGSRN